MYPSVEEFRWIVENGDITREEILKIQEMQYNFMNYSEEDQRRIQEIIDETLASATDPAREELRVLNGAIDEYRNLSRNTSSFNPETGMAILWEGSLSRNNIEFAAAYDLAVRVIGQPLTDARIKNYQRRNGLRPVDGIIGFDTYSKMLETSSNETEARETSPGSLYGSNLEEIDINENQARDMARVALLNETPALRETTRATIRTYQEAHNIGPDGTIGKETYVEMFAGTILGNVTDALEDDNLSRDLQDKIVFVIENGNPTGSNVVALQIVLRLFREQHGNDEGFDERYGNMYRDIETQQERFRNSEEGQAAVERAGETRGRDGRSLYAIATDENMSPSERVRAIASDPMLLIGGGILFLFGVFGWNTRFTNSFMKRLWIVIGGLMFGPAVIDRLGIWEALEDIDQRVGISEGFNNLFDGTSGSARDRIMEVRSQEWNDLNRLFPQAELLDSTISHFENIDALSTMSFDDINGYITALEAGNTDSLPAYLKDITINGVTLSNEQVAIALRSFREARGENDTIIGDLFENTSTVNLVGGALTTAGLIWGLVYGFPAIATWTLIWGLGTLGTANWESLAETLGLEEEIARFRGATEEILLEVSDEELRTTLQWIIRNGELAIETQTTQLTALIEDNSEFAEQIRRIIDANIRIRMIGLAAISQNIETVNLTEARTTLAGLISHIEENVTNETEKQSLLQTIRARIAELDSETEVRQVTDAEEQVSEIENDILAHRASIDVLNGEREELLGERSSADARRLAEIDARLAAIPAEIATLETQLSEKEIALTNANRELANIRVETSFPVVQAHKNFIENELQNAINTQGIITAVNVNSSVIIGIHTQINDIRDQISLAENSTEKTNLLSELDVVTNAIDTIKADFLEAYGMSENITAESVQAMNFDLSTVAWHDAFNQAVSQLSTVEISQELQDFLGIELQDVDQAREIFMQEYQRQIIQQETAFESAPANNIQALRNTLQRRTEMMERYTSLFEVAYENEAFQDIITQKREEIENLNIQDIEGFDDFYRRLVTNLQAEDSEKQILTWILEQNIPYHELKEFLTETIVNGDVQQLSEGLETILSTTFYTEIEQFINLEI